MDDNFPFDMNNVGAKKEATTVKTADGEPVKITKTTLQEKVRPEDTEKKMKDAKKNLLVSNPKPGAKPKAMSAQEKAAANQQNPADGAKKDTPKPPNKADQKKRQLVTQPVPGKSSKPGRVLAVSESVTRRKAADVI